MNKLRLSTILRVHAWPHTLSRRLTCASSAVFLALALQSPALAQQDAPPANTWSDPTPPPPASPEAVPRAAPDDYVAPPTSRLGPTQADYDTAAGNVPPGTTPREFVFDEPRRYSSRNEMGFLIGVPVWFTPERGVIGPGISFEGRFAHRFGFIAPEINVGWQINWLDEDELDVRYRSANLTLDSFFISAGARVYVLPEALLSPFISAAFDLSFWHFTGDNSTACGYYYCSTVANYDAGIGFSGRVGLAIVPNRRFQFEIGAKLAMAFPVGPFERTQGWVTPYLGFTFLF